MKGSWFDAIEVRASGFQSCAESRLESLAALPRLDDLGADAGELRERLLAVAESRAS